MYSHIPDNVQRGFLLHVFHSVTVEIHRQLREINLCNKKPTCIKMGKWCCIKFAMEQNYTPYKLPKSYKNLPIVIDNKLIGVIVVHAPP